MWKNSGRYARISSIRHCCDDNFHSFCQRDEAHHFLRVGDEPISRFSYGIFNVIRGKRKGHCPATLVIWNFCGVVHMNQWLAQLKSESRNEKNYARDRVYKYVVLQFLFYIFLLFRPFWRHSCNIVPCNYPQAALPHNGSGWSLEINLFDMLIYNFTELHALQLILFMNILLSFFAIL